MDIDFILQNMRASGIPVAVRAYVSLHAQSGCRISDLLAVDFSCISKNLNISILQGKGSQALIVQPVYYRDFWEEVKSKRLIPMAHYNRFYFYRLYRKFGIVIKKSTNKNSFVTHAFRKVLADDVYQIDNNIARVQGALGHRSVKSSEHYTSD